MFPYHNRIKQRISNGELIGYTYVEKYNQISPALLLYFKTDPHIRPIREHRFEEYNTLFITKELTHLQRAEEELS